MLAAKSHTFTRDEIVDLVRFKRLGRGPSYSLGV